MRADRLLSTVLLLQTHGRLSAPVLAQRLEVSVRTVLRDVEALSAAGVPVYTERGRGGGIALLPGWRTDVSGFTTAEARALFSGAGGPDDPQRPAWESALRKLMAATPEGRREPLQRAAERILVEPAGWRSRPRPVPWLAALQEAVFAARRAVLTYRSSGAERPSRCTVDPVGLVAKGGTWYLVGLHRGRARLFRVERVSAVDVLEAATPVDLPPLAQVWSALREQVERPRASTQPVRLLVHERALEVLLRVADGQLVDDPVLGPSAGGRQELLLRFRASPAARAVLLGFGADVEVLEPAELVADLVRTARDVLGTYGAAGLSPARTPGG
ncbi:WYL domain-containing protein [Kineococcus sp. T13]|uniref:WYL domain-containing protein n=1 Tax=Kineococcus vitellinus TaxID=2696565 RepID=UPI0014129DDA|nr:WYL domain-containing protein [Kineococcus vitellinus]